MGGALSVRDLRVRDRTVLLRVDYNVPLTGDGAVRDDTRIRATLPTLDLLLKGGARVVVLSHLGRPKGRRVEAMSLRPAAARLGDLLQRPVAWADDCIDAPAERAVAALPPGGVLVLENLRFHPEEEANDPSFAAALAVLGDCYVNDAFGTAHRAHASTVGLPERARPAAAGLLMQRELEFLGRLLRGAEPPYVAVIGGAKISGKIDVLRSLLSRVDALVIGGAMMFTFLRAQGHATGRSLVEEDRIDAAREVIQEATTRGVRLVLPTDCLASTAPDGSAPAHVVDAASVPAGEMGVDIGPRSIEAIGAVIEDARTVFWNGPLGIFEVPSFAEGTLTVARALAGATRRGAITVVGGGDSVAALAQSGLADAVTHVSTGGGASLEFLEGRVLPGVAALSPA